MPIMTGYEATLAIRNVETERRLADAYPPASPLIAGSLPSPSYPFPTSENTLTTNVGINPEPRDPRAPRHHPALIIALTGFSSKQDQEMAFEAGVDVFMTKP